jgi:dihydrofolate synthase/folylpolyglutamate synthase
MSPRERLFALEHFGIKLGLDNIRLLLDALRHPERAFVSVHIGGTNGKGSVTAMVERGLRAAGHRTGRYTSPHLAHIEERVAIDGAAIDPATFDAVTSDVLAVVDHLQHTRILEQPPTFFEVTTAIAFETFRRANVSVAVVEVGLGGRFDATNVIQPAVTAITSIAFDHERHLGHTLGEIAFEKAGIIKAGVPVIVGPLPLDARHVVGEVARHVGASVVETSPLPAGAGVAVTLSLQGAHQRENAAVAVEVLKHCDGAGRQIARDHIVAALTDVDWPARLEWFRLPAGDILLDAAHNPAGAAALARYVLDQGEPLPMVLGLMKDKDVDAIVRAIAPAVSRVVATGVDSPRALDARTLADRVTALVPAIEVEWRPTADEALDAALAHGPRAIVAGSIFLVGPLRERLRQAGAMPVRYRSSSTPFYLA